MVVYCEVTSWYKRVMQFNNVKNYTFIYLYILMDLCKLTLIGNTCNDKNISCIQIKVQRCNGLASGVQWWSLVKMNEYTLVLAFFLFLIASIPLQATSSFLPLNIDLIFWVFLKLHYSNLFKSNKLIMKTFKAG